jgi:hypothetical protein
VAALNGLTGLDCYRSRLSAVMFSALASMSAVFRDDRQYGCCLAPCAAL